MSLFFYQCHLNSPNDLITTYEATRAGFVSLALEKSRRSTPYVAEARALKESVSKAKTPADLLLIKHIEAGLLTAAGLSEKALKHLQPEDKIEAIQNLIKNFLEPAGKNFIEELVFRFLLTRGDTLGGSMRNIGGILAQRKLTRTIISTLVIAGIDYKWQHSKTKKWIDMSDDDSDIELSLRGLSWKINNQWRTMIYNLDVPLVKKNVDISLFNIAPEELDDKGYRCAKSYLALGELKGGIDPAGADEHWKTARTALDRIRKAFSKHKHTPYTFFIGAAIQESMANEIWHDLQNGVLTNAANLNDSHQLTSFCTWLTSL